jgi:hypothetical protein
MISLLWRAAIHDWRMSDGSIKKRFDLGIHEERFRKYLLGETGFPPDVTVVVTVCVDALSRSSFTSPSEGTPDNPHTCFTFLGRGVYFQTLVGEDVPPSFHRMCCYSSPEQFIFVRNGEKKILDAYLNLFATAEPVGKEPPYRIVPT